MESILGLCDANIKVCYVCVVKCVIDVCVVCKTRESVCMFTSSAIPCAHGYREDMQCAYDCLKCVQCAYKHVQYISIVYGCRKYVQYK